LARERELRGNGPRAADSAGTRVPEATRVHSRHLVVSPTRAHSARGRSLGAKIARLRAKLQVRMHSPIPVEASAKIDPLLSRACLRARRTTEDATSVLAKAMKPADDRTSHRDRARSANAGEKSLPKLTCLSRRSRGDKLEEQGRVRRRSQHRRTRSRQVPLLGSSVTASSRASFQHHSHLLD